MLLHNRYEEYEGQLTHSVFVHNASLILLQDQLFHVQWERQLIEMVIQYQVKLFCYDSLLEKENDVSVTLLLSSGVSKWFNPAAEKKIYVSENPPQIVGNTLRIPCSNEPDSPPLS